MVPEAVLNAGGLVEGRIDLGEGGRTDVAHHSAELGHRLSQCRKQRGQPGLPTPVR